MTKSESDVRELFQRFKENGMEEAVGVSIEERIQMLSKEKEKLTQSRHERIKQTGEMEMPDGDEAAKSIIVDMAESFGEDVEYGTVNFNDFVEYLHICEDSVTLESQVIQDHL